MINENGKQLDTSRPTVVSPKYKDIKKAVKLINTSKKPVMLIGVGAKHAKDELREFIEMAKIPVIHSLPAIIRSNVDFPAPLSPSNTVKRLLSNSYLDGHRVHNAFVNRNYTVKYETNYG